MQGPLRNRGHRLVRSCLSSLDHDPDPRGQSCRASAIERIDVVHRAAASRSLRNIKPQINFARYHHGCSEINIVYRGDRAHIERRNMKNLKIIQRYIFLGGIDWFLETTSSILNYEHSVISSFPFFSFRSYSFSALSRKICVLSVCASVFGVIRFPVSFFFFFFPRGKNTTVVYRTAVSRAVFSTVDFSQPSSLDEKYGGSHEQRNGGVLRDNYINALSDHTPAYKIFLG